MATKYKPEAVSAASTAADKLLVQKLEKTVQAEVMKAVTESIKNVMHEAIGKAIVAASKVPEKLEAKRPKEGGRCAEVWDELDRLAKDNHIPTAKEVSEIAQRYGWSPDTVSTQYYQWLWPFYCSGSRFSLPTNR